MVKIPRDILLVLAMTGGVIAQVTSTATPNAAEVRCYSQ